MDEFESLSHTRWECLYHVVFIPKCRRRTLYVGLRTHLGGVFRGLAEQRGESDRGGPPDARSCAHAVEGTAEIRGLAGGGLLQGHECDPLVTGVWGATSELFLVSTSGRGDTLSRWWVGR